MFSWLTDLVIVFLVRRRQDDIHSSRQLYQCLNLGHFSIQFLGHVGKQIIHAITEPVVGQIEINQDATDIDTEFAEPGISQVSVEKL